MQCGVVLCGFLIIKLHHTMWCSTVSFITTCSVVRCNYLISRMILVNLGAIVQFRDLVNTPNYTSRFSLLRCLSIYRYNYYISL